MHELYDLDEVEDVEEILSVPLVEEDSEEAPEPYLGRDFVNGVSTRNLEENYFRSRKADSLVCDLDRLVRTSFRHGASKKSLLEAISVLRGRLVRAYEHEADHLEEDHQKALKKLEYEEDARRAAKKKKKL